jgi:hypothetical protein
MNELHNSVMMKRAAERATKRTFFVAAALSAYQELEKISDIELAAYLRCSEEQLPKLALCRKPERASTTFQADVRKIAAYAGVDQRQFAKLLRVVESLPIFQTALSASGSGLLVAACDRHEPKSDGDDHDDHDVGVSKQKEPDEV